LGGWELFKWSLIVADRTNWLLFGKSGLLLWIWWWWWGWLLPDVVKLAFIKLLGDKWCCIIGVVRTGCFNEWVFLRLDTFGALELELAPVLAVEWAEFMFVDEGNGMLVGSWASPGFKYLEDRLVGCPWLINGLTLTLLAELLLCKWLLVGSLFRLSLETGVVTTELANADDRFAWLAFCAGLLFKSCWIGLLDCCCCCWCVDGWCKNVDDVSFFLFKTASVS
jgi:hypothetical protein